ncbi:MAG: hypothetical protein ACLGHJ_01895 [Gammaproteobacteria bacterium]
MKAFPQRIAALATAVAVVVAAPIVHAGKDPEETVPPNVMIEKPEKQVEGQRVKIVQKGEKFMVPTCRVAFRLENSASASTNSALSNIGCSSGSYSNCKSDASVSMSVVLANFSNADMQAATDAVCNDFVDQLKTAGKPVVTWKELPGNKAYDEIDFAEPKKDGVYHEGFNGSDYIVMAPSDGKLFFTHENLGLGDQGPASLGNWRAMNELSAKNKAVVLVPHFMVNFAEMSSSGRNKMLKSTAEVGAKPALGLESGATRLHIYQAKMRLAGDMGGLTVRDLKPVSSDIGEIREQKEFDNSGIVIPLANLFGATSAMTSKKSYNVLVADPEKFKAGVVTAGQLMNGVYAHVIKGYVAD